MREDIACTVPSWHGEITAGLHPATGGSGELACSADMLLEALVACAGVTLRAVATASGVTIRSGRVIAEGTWDARGTLGIDRSVPVGLTRYRAAVRDRQRCRSRQAGAHDPDHRALLRHPADAAQSAAHHRRLSAACCPAIRPNTTPATRPVPLP